MAGGLALSAVGYFMLARVGANTGLATFGAATFIFAFGASPVFTLTNDVIIGSAPPERAGAAAGISETCAEFGGALGIAIFGSIGIAIYRVALAQTMPLGLSHDVSEAATATLGGAVAVSQQLSGGAATALLDAAREAFLRGLRVCAVISGFGTLALALFAAKAFPQQPASARADVRDSGFSARPKIGQAAKAK